LLLSWCSHCATACSMCSFSCLLHFILLCIRSSLFHVETFSIHSGASGRSQWTVRLIGKIMSIISQLRLPDAAFFPLASNSTSLVGSKIEMKHSSEDLRLNRLHCCHIFSQVWQAYIPQGKPLHDMKLYPVK
jgi:hypothetical protein